MAESVKKREFEFSGAGGTKIAVTSFRVKNPIAVIQIAHGMAEHRKRYYDFARYLTTLNFSVYINDHRGHGDTARLNGGLLGFFADENGWQLLIEDMALLSDLIKEENKDIPLVLLGHSMGSILARGYVFNYSDKIVSAVFVGTNGDSGFMPKMGMKLAESAVKKDGPRKISPKFDKLMFGGFNKKIKNSRTDFDWLCTNEANVDGYINDPDCGFICTASMYRDIIGGLLYASNKKDIASIRKDLPILLVSGGRDPVGRNGKGIINCSKVYKRAGIEDLSVKIFEGLRHEILNETDKESVYSHISDWILSRLK